MLVLSDCAEARLLGRGAAFFTPVMSRGGQLADLSLFSPAVGSTLRLAERMQVTGSSKGQRGACGCIWGQRQTRAAAPSFHIHFRKLKKFLTDVTEDALNM